MVKSQFFCGLNPLNPHFGGLVPPFCDRSPTPHLFVERLGPPGPFLRLRGSTPLHAAALGRALLPQKDAEMGIVEIPIQ